MAWRGGREGTGPCSVYGWLLFALRLCLLCVFNNPDPGLDLVLLAISTLAVEAEVFFAGASLQAGSEAGVAVLERGSRFFLHFDDHRGGGIKVERKWSLWIWRLGSSSSSMLGKRRWRLLKCSSSCGDHGGGRWPTSLSPSMTFLAERRLYLFLPACEPLGRQFQLVLGGHGVQVLQRWRPRRPKWCVPGGGVVRSKRKLIWTRSRFLPSVRGPPCKSQGRGCNFVFLLDLSVKCTALLCDE